MFQTQGKHNFDQLFLNEPEMVWYEQDEYNPYPLGRHGNVDAIDREKYEKEDEKHRIDPRMDKINELRKHLKEYPEESLFYEKKKLQEKKE